MTAQNIHAGCVLLGGAGRSFGAPEDAGILILGGSGSGKSDLMLRLIAAGGMLVADDRTDLTVEGDILVASPPRSLAGLMEVRGLGVVAFPHRTHAAVALAVELIPGEMPARMPLELHYRPPEGLVLPERAWPALIRLNPFENSAPAKIAAAATALAHGRLRQLKRI